MISSLPNAPRSYVDLNLFSRILRCVARRRKQSYDTIACDIPLLQCYTLLNPSSKSGNNQNFAVKEVNEV